MRGRKRVGHLSDRTVVRFIKKESPNEGTETAAVLAAIQICRIIYKKRIPE